MHYAHTGVRGHLVGVGSRLLPSEFWKLGHLPAQGEPLNECFDLQSVVPTTLY